MNDTPTTNPPPAGSRTLGIGSWWAADPTNVPVIDAPDEIWHVDGRLRRAGDGWVIVR